MRHVFCFAFFFSFYPFYAQQPAEVKGYFLSDSFKVGEHIAYSLSIKYPIKYQVFFPDSAYDFQPFELVKKYFYETQKKQNFYYDSALYYLRTFETDSFLTYSLPVFLLVSGDTIAQFSRLDTIFFKSILPDTLKNYRLLVDTSLVYIPYKLNYMFFIMLVVVLLICSFLFWKFFGKKITDFLFRYRIKLKHRQFVRQFNELKKNVLSDDDIQTWSNLLQLWKKHISLLTGKNIQTLTSREICLELGIKNLKNSLQQIDNRMYGNQKIDIEAHIDTLLQVANQLYEENYNYK